MALFESREFSFLWMANGSGGPFSRLSVKLFRTPKKLSERVEDYNLAQNPCAIYMIINFGKFTSSNDVY